MTTVGIAGEGPAVESVVAAVEDTSADAVRPEAGDLAQADVAVDVRPVGKSAGADRATGAETPLVVVELGGVGGRPVGGVDAAVSGHAPGTACYDCLRRRVEAVGSETGGTDPGATTARFAGAVAGRELATLVAGGESPLLGGVIEVPHASRRVLPAPYCGCAAGEDRTLRTDDGGRSLEATLASAEAAFDEREIGRAHV